MDIKGKWYNELGSVLTVEKVTGNKFELSYVTGVSTNKCAKGSYPGTGYLNYGESGICIGFVVSWQNSESNCNAVTSWCGYFTGDFAEPEIVTFWLLTSADPENSWASTLVGEDRFTRYEPTAADVEKNVKSKRQSHM